jgi:saccharopine dehydrogenase (NAD+, L-lysine-forming)
MSGRVLLYGATGYSGRLIAAEARRQQDRGLLGDIVLAGRDGIALAEIAAEHDLAYTAFALDDQSKVEAVLAEFDVVLNAAGPFAETGLRLAKCAIATACHYVDINGEVDVYQKLDDLHRAAAQRGVALVSGAGFTAAVSDLLLARALTLLTDAGWNGRRLGAIRIAVARMTDFSRGSLITMLRSVREEVITVRDNEYLHVPVGRLERTFDFGVPPRPQARDARTGDASPLRIATAANVVDTLTAFQTARRQAPGSTSTDVGTIESYVDMPRPIRLGYQLGALSAVWLQLPGVQQATRLQLAQLPEGPDEDDRRRSHETVVVQIDSEYGAPLVDWRLRTQNSYDVTARCALSAARALAVDPDLPRGWLSPSEVLVDTLTAVKHLEQPPTRLNVEVFGPCEFEGRPVMRLTSDLL